MELMLDSTTSLHSAYDGTGTGCKFPAGDGWVRLMFDSIACPHLAYDNAQENGYLALTKPFWEMIPKGLLE